MLGWESVTAEAFLSVLETSESVASGAASVNALFDGHSTINRDGGHDTGFNGIDVASGRGEVAVAFEDSGASGGGDGTGVLEDVESV